MVTCPLPPESEQEVCRNQTVVAYVVGIPRSLTLRRHLTPAVYPRLDEIRPEGLFGRVTEHLGASMPWAAAWVQVD